MAQMQSIRHVVQRLNATPATELPYIAYFLATTISQCPQAFRSGIEEGSDSSVSDVRRLKIKVSSLLQNRSQGSRFTAIILVKAIIEAGGVEVLTTCEPWTRTLVSNLSKPDCASVKSLAIVLLTRIFSLSGKSAGLQRDITTALLPGFLTTTFNLVKPKDVQGDTSAQSLPSALLGPVLECWRHLLPRNPNIFRPFISRIQSICTYLITDRQISSPVVANASRILSSLSVSAPKNSSESHWVKVCRNVMFTIHEMMDEVFQTVKENWQSSKGHLKTEVLYENPMNNEAQAILPEFPAWNALHEGPQRLIILLEFLENLVCQPYSVAHSIPVAFILDVTGRLTSITLSSYHGTSGFSSRTNPELSKEVHSELQMHLALIHLVTLRLLKAVARCLSNAVVPFWRSVLEQTLTVLRHYITNGRLRSAVYDVVCELLPITGSFFEQSDVKSCSLLCTACCQDVLRLPLIEQNRELALPSHTRELSMDFLFQNSTTFSLSTETWSSLGNQTPYNSKNRSLRLLTLFVLYVYPDKIPQVMRSEIDRVIVFAGDQEALLASTLNPPTRNESNAGPSLLPFLARTSSSFNPGTEALLRPRMPVISILYEHTYNGHKSPSEGPSIDYKPLEKPDIDQPAIQNQGSRADVDNQANNFSQNPESIPSPYERRQTTDYGTRPPKEKAHEEMLQDADSTSRLRRPFEEDHPIQEKTPKKQRLASPDPNLQNLDEMTVDFQGPVSESNPNATTQHSVISTTTQKEQFMEHTTQPVHVETSSKARFTTNQKLGRIEADSDSDIPEIDIEPDTDDEDLE